MNDYSLRRLSHDPVFWVLLYLSMPAIIQVAYDVIQSIQYMQPYSADMGLDTLLSMPIALYLGIGLQIPRRAAIEAAAVQESTMIANGFVRFEDDMDAGLREILDDEDMGDDE